MRAARAASSRPASVNTKRRNVRLISCVLGRRWGVGVRFGDLREDAEFFKVRQFGHNRSKFQTRDFYSFHFQ
jgi:hypothetical protein